MDNLLVGQPPFKMFQLEIISANVLRQGGCKHYITSSDLDHLRIEIIEFLAKTVNDVSECEMPIKY
jgi:hypothetical protein